MKVNCVICVCIFVLNITTNLSGTLAGKILFVYPISTRSETHLFLPIAKSLATKGHTITIVSSVYTENLTTQIEQIIPTTPLKDTDFMLTSGPLEERKLSRNKLSYLMSFDPSALIERCHAVYQNEDFKKLAQRDFDLIFMSGLFNDCLEPLAYQLKVPYIIMTSLPTPHWIASRSGLRMPPSFVPVPIVDFSSDMEFSERFLNTIIVWLFSIVSNLLIVPDFEKIYRTYLGNDFPGILEIERNLSMIMSNSHFSLNFARPTLPDTIEIGGIHCRPAQPLPKNLDSFITGAKDGIIYFSLGSVIRTETFPDELRKIFLTVFSKLKQKVLWKWDTEETNDLPSNVKLAKWLPQQDVLGHPNVKLFISHGGLLSTQETIYHGVPMLGIPFFVDQDINTREAEKSGFALREEILEITEQSLANKIGRILNEPSFQQEAKKISRIFKDQPQTPLERAVFWVQYVLRQGGAPHLKSPARTLNFIQYYSIDVIAVILCIGIASFTSITILVYRICCAKKNKLVDQQSSSAHAQYKKRI